MQVLTQPTPEYRPSVHFTPEQTWMNDPNGLILHKGQYHLFFQNNPFGQDWGNMSWGHAVSSDLVTWRELPVAIPATDEEMVFSGSVVWDRFNTSGLGEGDTGPLVALYTSAHTAADPQRSGQQTQSVAYSADDGLTWTRYSGNPVLERGSTEFRDPKVFWHEQSGRWVMLCVEAVDRQVLFHSSADLTSWTLESVFGPLGDADGVWECPDLVPVPVEGSDALAWVLVVSFSPGGFCGGSGMQYFIGDFDGRTFSPAVAEPRWLDFGPDFYAAVSFQGTEVPTIMGWMSNWDYARQVPTHPWRSAMSLARTISLAQTEAGLLLRQRLVLPDSRRADVVVEEFSMDGAGELRVEWGDGGGPVSVLVLRRDEAGGVTVDRSGADPHGVHAAHGVTPTFRVPGQGVPGVVVEDHGLVEILLDDGLFSITMQTFPGAGPARVTGAGQIRLAAESGR